LQAVGSSFEKYQYDVCLSNESPPTKTKYSSLHLVINSQSSTLNRSLSVFWLREFVLEALKQHSDIQVQLLSANKAHQVEQQRTFADLSNRVSVTDSQPSVSHSLTVIQTADLILSPDTYAVHAAGAWNIPVIALYEPNSSTMDLWGPASDSYVQICAPTGKAVSDIGIEHVAEALAQLLKTAALRERVLLK
jgi:ADP-heptose:LPS heptosyltransferase